MADAYQLKGDFDLALIYLIESLDIYNKAFNQNDHPDIFQTLNNIGRVYKAKGDFAKSIEFFFLSFEMKKSFSSR
jgi:tetratricopeptide (TPR) repeat protein